MIVVFVYFREWFFCCCFVFICSSTFLAPMHFIHTVPVITSIEGTNKVSAIVSTLAVQAPAAASQFSDVHCGEYTLFCEWPTTVALLQNFKLAAATQYSELFFSTCIYCSIVCLLNLLYLASFVACWLPEENHFMSL